MASIKQALKNRTSYTNKNGVTLSYDTLRSMTRLNNQLRYYNKTNKIKGDTKERIKIGSVGEDYHKKVRRVKTTLNYRKYARYTDQSKFKKTPNLINKINKVKKEIEQSFKEFDIERGGSGLIKVPEIEDMRPQDFEIVGTAEQTLNYRINLMETIRSNFKDLPDSAFNNLMETVNDMTFYELHRLSKDIPDLMDYIYNSPDARAERLRALMEGINQSSYTQKFSDDDIDEYTDYIPMELELY